MIIIYEIPIFLIVMLVLGVFGIAMENIDTIVIVCVVAYALIEMLCVYFVLHSSKKDMLKKKNVNFQKVKKQWFSMYVCSLFRVLVITITLFLSLRKQAVKMTEGLISGAFLDVLFSGINGIFTCLIIPIYICISWGISLKIGGEAFDGYGGDLTDKEVTWFNIFQIISSVIMGALLIS